MCGYYIFSTLFNITPVVSTVHCGQLLHTIGKIKHSCGFAVVLHLPVFSAVTREKLSTARDAPRTAGAGVHEATARPAATRIAAAWEAWAHSDRAQARPRPGPRMGARGRPSRAHFRGRACTFIGGSCLAMQGSGWPVHLRQHRRSPPPPHPGQPRGSARGQSGGPGMGAGEYERE